MFSTTKISKRLGNKMSIEERRLTTMLKFQKTLDGFASREIIQIKIYYTDMFLLFFFSKTTI